MQVHAWVFDLGNTLMSIPDRCDEEACLQRLLGYHDMDQVRSVVYRTCHRHQGQTSDEFVQRFCEAVNPDGAPDIERLVRDIWAASIEAAEVKPYAYTLLDQLRKKGMKLALVSNTPPTSHPIIDSLHLRERFDTVVFSCDVGFLKPDPRIFRVALDRLGVEAESSVIVGDKIRTDILGGAILGMRSILLECRLRQMIENGQNYVDAIVSKLEEIETTELYRSSSG